MLIYDPSTKIKPTIKLHQSYINFQQSGIREKVISLSSNYFILVMPPYIDVISGLFSSNIMRKPPAYVPLIKKGSSNTAPQSNLAAAKYTTQKSIYTP